MNNSKGTYLLEFTDYKGQHKSNRHSRVSGSTQSEQKTTLLEAQYTTTDRQTLLRRPPTETAT